MKKKKKEINYTKEELETIKTKNKGINTITGIIVGMFICITIYLIYNLLKLANIETLIRYIIIFLLSVLCIVVLSKYLKLRRQPKRNKYLLFILLLLILGFGEFTLSSIIDRGINTIDKINKDKITYTSSLIAMKDGKFTTKKSITKAKIGIISDSNDTEGYVLAQTIIKNNKVKDEQLIEYDDYISMLTDLYNGEVDQAFVSGSYVDKFSTIEKFQNIKNDVTELDKYSKLMKKVTDKNTKISSKKVTEPFTLLLLGVDSETEDISKTSGLGDSIMLITFNPNTLNATIFSIPRDTFVPISCYRNAKSKITHAASGGDSCMINTVENFTGIDIDYYAKLNFKGLTNLVDELGGIDVDVPYSFCESNSLRSLDYRDLIYVNKGWQHLNGEQALALSRNRKEVAQCGKEWNKGTRNDFVRGQNQQLVIKAIMSKAKTIKSINKVYDILDKISISMDTNLTREQILDFYNVFKKILLSSESLADSNDIISMQKTYLNGSGGLIHDNIMNMKLYEYVPSSQSLKAIVNAMKINLELMDEEYDNSFSFTIDEPYEPKVIGADLYGGVEKYPDPTNDDDDNDNKQTCDKGEEIGADGKSCVCKYGYSRNTSGVCVEKENENDNKEAEEKISVKSFIGSNTTQAKSWCTSNGIYYNFVEESVSDKNKDGIIVSQDVTSGAVDKGVTIKFTVGKYNSTSSGTSSNDNQNNGNDNDKINDTSGNNTDISDITGVPTQTE